MSPMGMDSGNSGAVEHAGEMPGGAVLVDEDGLLITGEPSFVQAYVSRLTDLAKEAVSVADLSAKDLADVAAAGVAVAGAASAVGEYVKLSPRARDLATGGGLLPKEPGLFTTTAVETSVELVLDHFDLGPAVLGQTQMLAVQMAMTTIALRTAVAAVERAVERVEGKATAILQLAQADRAGDVLGLYRTLAVITEQYDATGRLSQADWDSIAPLGPALDQAIVKLRFYAGSTLTGFDPSAPVTARAAYLERLIDQQCLIETLQLLVVGEEALYRWNRLKIARIEATEPEHLQAALDAMNETLRVDLEADAGLLHHARHILDEYTAIRPLEILRRGAAESIKLHAAALKAGLDEFAVARRTGVAEWTDHEMPDLGDAMQELKRRADDGMRVVTQVSSKAMDIGVAGVGSLGAGMQRFAERRARDRSGGQAAIGEGAE